MSKQGSKKEMIFNLFLKEYPEVIRHIVGISIERIKLEYNSGAQRVDLHGINSDMKIDIYIETQITTADEDHLAKTIKLISNTAEGYVIWIASRFRKVQYLKEIKNYLKSNPGKYINFYAVEINPEVLECLIWSNKQYELDVLNNLEEINKINKPLKIVDFYNQMPTHHIGNAYTGDVEYDFNREDDIKAYFLDKLCEQIPYYLNLHSTKKHAKNCRIMQIGAGMDGVMYHCAAIDRRNRAFVEIRFNDSKESWYKAFKSKRNYIRREIHDSICFNDNNRIIGFYLSSNPKDVQKDVEVLVDMFEKFINFFTQYTYRRSISGLLDIDELSE